MTTISPTSMGGRSVISAGMIARAKELHADGMKWSRISARLGVSEDALRRRCDERYREHRNARVRAWRSSGGKLVPVVADAAQPPPADTRTLTARVLGDPLPGRSALDRMRAAQPVATGPFSPVKATRTYYLRGFLAP